MQGQRSLLDLPHRRRLWLHTNGEPRRRLLLLLMIRMLRLVSRGREDTNNPGLLRVMSRLPRKREVDNKHTRNVHDDLEATSSSVSSHHYMMSTPPPPPHAPLGVFLETVSRCNIRERVLRFRHLRVICLVGVD